MYKHILPAVFAIAFAGLGVACNKADKNAPGGTASSSAKIDTAAAKEMFDTRCSPCHGTSGHGDGPASGALTPKPRNYSDSSWQASVTDEQIKKTIVYGGAAVGKSPIMPASPDLDAKPEVVEGLVRIVRGFGK
jgi:mono/diheme cytochrome c family protein